MRRIFSCIILLTPIVSFAQNYNPFVAQGIVSPAPLLPLEANGTGTVSFNVGNSGSDNLALVTNQEMMLIITLSRGVPNNADPIAAVSGTFKSYFSWTYDAGINTYTAKQNQVIPGGLNGAGTIIIAYKVTQNSTMLTPQNGFNCNVTPPAYTNGINSLADDQVSSYTWTSFVVGGKVFDDADGYTDSQIDGTGTNASGGLYVSIVGPGNSIVATVPVNADGTYTLYPPSSGSYTLVLHTNPSGSTTSSLPTNWANTAEGLGTTSDGTANGYINVSLAASNVTNANFGVDQLPQTENVNENIAIGVSPGQKYVLDNSPLNGSDPEDGSAAGSLSTGYTFLIKSLPSNAQLYYNNVLITPADVAAGTGTALITNYDPTKLAIAFTVTPTVGTQGVFTYVAVDAAGNPDASPATYTVTVVTILPAHDVVLSAQRQSNDVSVSWKTLSEQGTDYFRVEKSTDGRSYRSLGTKIPAAGNSNQQLQYQFLDKDEISPVVLYRVRVYYKDGKSAMSNIAVVRLNATNDKVQVFPNPVVESYYVSFTKAGRYHLQLTDGGGRTVMTRDMEISTSNLNVLVERGMLAAGNYQLSIQNRESGNRENIKLIFIQR